MSKSQTRPALELLARLRDNLRRWRVQATNAERLSAELGGAVEERAAPLLRQLTARCDELEAALAEAAAIEVSWQNASARARGACADIERSWRDVVRTLAPDSICEPMHQFAVAAGGNGAQ